jgi:acyl-CoA thioesterase-1
MFLVFVYPLFAAPSSTDAVAAPFEIVVVGASNTAGWGVGRKNAFPALLENLLRSRGIQANVRSAGRIADTTAGMLRRIDSAAPSGTDLVILQPGGNDLRFFGTLERRQANIAAIQRRLRERGIKVIVYDPVFPRGYFIWDGIHFKAAAHAQIAAQLAPLVESALRE